MSELPEKKDAPEDQPRVPIKIEEACAALAMALICVITFANVLVRYFTNVSFAFTEEFSIFLMVVLTLFGAAAAFARSLPPSNVRFEQTDTGRLAGRGATFDFVVSNHLLHHLADEDLPTFLGECAELGRVVLHNDIARADLAYVGFAALTGPFFRGSFITPDGLTSVRRSFTRKELRSVAPEGWRVSSPYPFRLLLSRGL